MTTDRLLASLELENLRPFHALPDVLALRDLQDLMAYPFFALSKRRMEPIDYTSGDVSIRVESLSERGIATIWDADILIWAASQIVDACDSGLTLSRLITATPYEILTFIGRGTSGCDYRSLKNALDRLRNTSVTTSLRSPASACASFTWISEWKPCQCGLNKPSGIALLLPEWFYSAVQERSTVLTIDRAYFDLTGGLERWLYRLVRKHGGKQRDGWTFSLRRLHQKSGSRSPFARFAFEIRAIIERQPLPGYTLFTEVSGGRVFLAFEPLRVRRRKSTGKPVDNFPQPCESDRRNRKTTPGVSGKRFTEYQENGHGASGIESGHNALKRKADSTLNLESNYIYNRKIIQNGTVHRHLGEPENTLRQRPSRASKAATGNPDAPVADVTLDKEGEA